MNSILPYTTLCAIVRDEMMNPAGGIRRFVESHVPFVEQAVIIDTGSKDGTREELDRLTREYANLRVYDEDFIDFSSARNKSLEKVKTAWTLVLDADELLTRKNFKTVRRAITDNPKHLGYSFEFRNITPNGGNCEGVAHNPRLFSRVLAPFYERPWGKKGEELFSVMLSTSGSRSFDDAVVNIPGAVKKLPASIIHFVPNFNNNMHKHTEFYNVREGTLLRYRQPCSLPNFNKWKALNPHREDYR
ncbi:MAG: glycosyltransferase [Nanoarchaeota archaeon]